MLNSILKLLFRWQNKRNEMINNPDALAKKKALRDGVDTDGEMADEQEEVIIEKMLKQEEAVVDKLFAASLKFERKKLALQQAEARRMRRLQL